MADNITPQQVRHVAHLSRLKLGPGELEHYQRDLSSILDYVDQINELDTDDVEPTAHPLSIHTVTGADDIAASYDPNRALQNAPCRQGSFFVVPRVLDQRDSD